MGRLHAQDVATYVVSGEKYHVIACWSGEWSQDEDRFYDIYDDKGECLNLGEPWHDDGKGTPTKDEVEDLLVSCYPERIGTTGATPNSSRSTT